jgi:hypothetical protein
MSQQLKRQKRQTKTRKIGITIDKSKKQKKNFYREVTEVRVVGHVSSSRANQSMSQELKSQKRQEIGYCGGLV